jgi:hypothetical protein
MTKILDNPSQNTSPISHSLEKVAFAAPSEVRAHGGEAALGNNTKSTPAFDKQRTENQLHRRRRYEMLTTAREVSPLESRTRSCSCYVGKDHSGNIRDFVSIQKTVNGSRWNGLSVCGSVWSCPVCSGRIMMERQDQVMKAMTNWREMSGYVLMVTLTFRHKRFDGLLDTITKFTKALSRMKASRKYKNLKESIGFFGAIRALEITHGSNGWHPHTHDLIFIENQLNQDQITKFETELFNLWSIYCFKYGLGLPNKKHGVKVDFREGDSLSTAIGAYVTKWGKEITSSHTKLSKGDSRSPWQILSSLNEKWTFTDSKLWKEYTSAMHGKAILYWSKGLKAALSIEDLTDQEIVENEDGKIIIDELIVTKAEFYAICRLKKQSHVLDRFDISSLNASIYIDELVSIDIQIRQFDKCRHKALEASIKLSTLNKMKSLGI